VDENGEAAAMLFEGAGKSRFVAGLGLLDQRERGGGRSHRAPQVYD
jgi:hypothetical protein